MDFYEMTDQAISTEIGERIKKLRLRRNISQQQLSDVTLLSLNAIKSLEAGKGKLSTIIAVLRELNALDGIDNFIPDINISPIDLAKRQGRKRMRASVKRKKPNAKR